MHTGRCWKCRGSLIKRSLQWRWAWNVNNQPFFWDGILFLKQPTCKVSPKSREKCEEELLGAKSCCLASLWMCIFCSDFSEMKIFYTKTFFSFWLIIIIIQKICSAHISRNTGASPFSLTINVLGSFTCITQHTGPPALRPIRRTQQLWLSVLLKDTSAVTSQAGIRTHILTTPELESNALDRSTNFTSSSLSNSNLVIL